MALTLLVAAYQGLPPSRPMSMEFGPDGGTIGRGSNSDFVLPDPLQIVSRTQASIQFRDGGYFILDHGRSPVMLNDKAIGNGREAQLSDGDQLGIGDYSLLVSVELDMSLSEKKPSLTLADRDFGVSSVLGHWRSPTPSAKPIGVRGLPAATGLTTGIDARFEKVRDASNDLFPTAPHETSEAAVAAKAADSSPTPPGPSGLMEEPAPAEVVPDAAVKLAADWRMAPEPRPVAPPSPAALFRAPIDIDLSETEPVAPAEPLQESAPEATPVAEEPVIPESFAAPEVPVDSADSTAIEAPSVKRSEEGESGIDAVAAEIEAEADSLGAPSADLSESALLNSILHPGHAVPVASDDADETETAIEPPIAETVAEKTAEPEADPVAESAIAESYLSTETEPVAAAASESGIAAVPTGPAEQLLAAGYARALGELMVGAQVPELTGRVGNTPEPLKRVGDLLRSVVSGLQRVLEARGLAKRAPRSAAAQPGELNALKTSADASEALLNLLVPGAGPMHMPPDNAVTEAFEELHAHQLAVQTATQAALQDVLRRFHPALVERRLREPTWSEKLMPWTRKARLWDLMHQVHFEIQRDSQEEFDRLFNQHFRVAYEEQLAKQRAARKPEQDPAS